MSPETIAFLRSMLDAITLQSGAPDFDEWVVNIQRARRELAALDNAPQED